VIVSSTCCNEYDGGEDGLTDGVDVGDIDGLDDGFEVRVGESDGLVVGDVDGEAEGTRVGTCVGVEVG
jgi:hypothetical protein